MRVLHRAGVASHRDLASALVMTVTERLIGIVVALILATPPRAVAQTASAQADLMFRRGKALMAAGQIAQACAAFDASQQLEPTIPTRLNQANCRQRNGQLTTAWGLYVEVAEQTAAATDPASRQMHATARDRADKLEPRLSTLRVVVPDGHRVVGLEIVCNDRVLEPATWNQALPIDGGTYQVAARARDHTAWSTTVVLAAEHDAKVVELPELEPAERVSAASPEASSAQPAVAVLRQPADPGTGSPWTTRRKVAVITAAGGVLALATGTVLGVLAKNKQRDAHALCADTAVGCDGADRANDLVRDGHNLAITANVAFGIGAAAAISAGVLWLTGAPEARRAVAIVPSASPHQLTVTATGRF